MIIATVFLLMAFAACLWLGVGAEIPEPEHKTCVACKDKGSHVRQRGANILCYGCNDDLQREIQSQKDFCERYVLMKADSAVGAEIKQLWTIGEKIWSSLPTRIEHVKHLRKHQ